jgi:hypothetical protein
MREFVGDLNYGKGDWPIWIVLGVRVSLLFVFLRRYMALACGACSFKHPL